MSIFTNFPELNLPMQGIENVAIPNMIRIRQKYDPQRIEDVSGCIRQGMERNIDDKDAYLGKRICITVGSRGIPDLDIMIKTVCDILKEWGSEPFIVPAMGSHGGAAAEGQTEMITGYNITEETMGVPILSSLEVVQYAALGNVPLYCDKYAFESDGIIVFNKVKPHTEFRGIHESGIAKMMAIGLANHRGCSMFHTFGFARIGELIPKVAEIFIEKCPVAFGIGIVQNAYDEICNIEVCRKSEILKKDAELLEIAKEKIANFKFKECDVLVIDEIGKNISGNGYDSNVVGRNNSGDFPEVLTLTRLVILGLTKETHNNGSGIALADFSTRKCLNSIDWYSTLVNALSAGLTKGGKAPMYADNDQEAIKFAIGTCPSIDFRKVKLARIKNTLAMSEILVSESLYEMIKDRDDVEYISGPEPMKFDAESNII